MNHEVVVLCSAALLAVLTGCTASGSAPTSPRTAQAAAPPPVSAPRGPCTNEPLRASGATYFVCDCQAGASASCVAGDDANPGRTRRAPWRSIAKAYKQFARMAAGDTLALCRGGRWNGLRSQGRWANPACRANATCDVRDYDPRPEWGDGTEGPPILAMASTAEGMNAFDIGGGTGPVTTGLRFLNLEVRDGNWGTVLWGNVTDVDFCGVTLDGFAIAQYVAKSSTTARVTLRHSLVRNSREQGYLGACDGCVLDSNLWDGNGGPSNRDHSIYVGANPDPGGTIGGYSRTTGMRVVNNEIRRSAQSGGSCIGGPLVVHEPHDGLVIENNLIVEAPGTSGPGCWGISVGNGGDAPGHFTAVAIRRNRIFNAGNQAIGIENCEDCIVESNVVVLDQEGSAIVAPMNLRSFGVGPNLENTRTIVRNNTVYFGKGARGGRGIVVGGEGSGHVVANNAIVLGEGGAKAEWACFDLGLPASAYSTVDNNLCHRPGGRAEWVRGKGSLSTWQASTGLESRSIQADPLFVNASLDPATANFTLRDGSPALAAGTGASSPTRVPASVSWSATDPGKVRAPPPDVGAFQR